MSAAPASPFLGLGGGECVGQVFLSFDAFAAAGGQNPQMMPGAYPLAPPAAGVWAQAGILPGQDPRDIGGQEEFTHMPDDVDQGVCSEDIEQLDLSELVGGPPPPKKQRVMPGQMGQEEVLPSQAVQPTDVLQFPELPTTPGPQHATEAGVPPPAPAHVEAPAQQPVQPGVYTPTMVEFPTWETALNKVRALLGNGSFELTRGTFKTLQQDPVTAVRVWKAVHGGLMAHERDMLLDEMELMDVLAHPTSATKKDPSKNEWRNQWNYLCHFMRWIAAYSILASVTVEEAASHIEEVEGRYDRDGVAVHFETWKGKAARVLPLGSTLRQAWDKAGKGSDKRTRDRLEMYAAGCAVLVQL